MYLAVTVARSRWQVYIDKEKELQGALTKQPLYCWEDLPIDALKLHILMKRYVWSRVYS